MKHCHTVFGKWGWLIICYFIEYSVNYGSLVETNIFYIVYDADLLCVCF